LAAKLADAGLSRFAGFGDDRVHAANAADGDRHVREQRELK
jgi:hypothetical protein